MNWATHLSRDELLLDIDAIREHPDFVAIRDIYLQKAVRDLDQELVEVLLNAGANPNVRTPWHDGLLHHLAHEYYAAKNTKGQLILQMLDTLLRNGADPNQVGANNWRAMDGCIERNQQVLVELFVKYGANPEQRRFV